MRFQILQNVIFLFLGIITAVLTYMQLVRGEYYHERSLNNRIRVVSIEAPRGRILDRGGAVLADNRLSFNIAVIPQDIENKDALFGFLSAALNKDRWSLETLYARHYVTPFEPVIIARDIDRGVLINIEENRFRYPGLGIEESFERFYPFHEDGAHALGYVGKIDAAQAEALWEYGRTPLSIVGKSGVERFYDDLLEGSVGGRQIEVNSRGQEVSLLGFKEPSRGKDIGLSIDQRVQSTASELLAGRPGSVVVMDMSNGDVLSIVSSPAFDPNVFIDSGQNDKIREYMRGRSSPLLNRAISGQYPPGSVFKALVALSALELNKITPRTAFDCPGHYMIGGSRFGCPHEHGREDLFGAIAHSCNVYFFHIGQMVTAPVIDAYARAFGLNRLTGIDLPFESQGNLLLPSRKKNRWYAGDTLNLSIGQGDTLATPLQLTVLMAAIANDGIVLKPRLLKTIDGKVLPAPDLAKRPIVRLRDSTWRAVQQGLRMTVEDEQGTGHLLSTLNGMHVWGKTGTAQAGRLQENHAWFAGYVRSPKNNLAFCVFLEHGGSSANAVALTRDLLERIQSFGVI